MTSTMARHPWAIVPAPRPEATLRLLCFPYAGGGPWIFSSWAHLFPDDVEVCAVQLPGRGSRLGEPLITRWDDAIERLADGLTAWMDRPFAFFGHSLGAALAFELACRLRRDRRTLPLHLFVSARRAPHVPQAPPLAHTLPHEEFVEELRRLAGTPDEVLCDPELMDVFIPILRADFALSETHSYRQEPAPMAVPITAYGGIDDHSVSEAELQAWRRHTTGSFRRVLIPGGHFYVTQARQALVADVADELRASLEGSCVHS